MELMINIDLKKLDPPITYRDKILLIGSCFTEHIGNALSKLKFHVLQNPHGILFGPDAVCKSLNRYVQDIEYHDDELIQLNELWTSWEHHSRFSNTNRTTALKGMNDSIHTSHEFLQEADWLIITLGSSFSYRLTEIADKGKHAVGDAVANCHRAPSNWFEKKMMDISTISLMLEKTINELTRFNPNLKILFTVSPVRHIRDGVVENNRSKARLIEVVHSLVEKYDFVHYFPAYELVIDVLRDYRFYDIDLVHPNYPATDFVLEKFSETCIDIETQQVMQEVKKIVTARKHRAFQPETMAHMQFLMNHYQKTVELQKKYPWLDLSDEIEYFSQV